MQHIPIGSSELRREDIIGRETSRPSRRQEASAFVKLEDSDEARAFAEVLREWVEENPWVAEFLKL